MKFAKNIASAIVFSLALATVPASAFNASEYLTSAWTSTKTNLDLIYDYMTLRNSAGMILAALLVHTALKKPQEKMKEHDNLIIDFVDNTICGQNEKEVGLKEAVDSNGVKILKKHKIEAAGLIGTSLAMVKPLAYAGAVMLLVKNVFGLNLPGFAETNAKAVIDVAGALKVGA